jgi:twitching motility protein PilI
MANRQALRELQTRLAERLQAARTNTSSAASWLAVQASGRNYLLPLEQSGEIFAWTGILRVPYARPWFWGVANLRGNLAGVVDVGTLLGHPVERTEQSLYDVSLISINAALQVNAALVIDRLMGLRGEQDLQRLESAADTAADGVAVSMGPRYVDKAGEVWQALHLQKLVQSPEFLSIRI